MDTPEYEFTDTQNILLDDLAKKMRFVAYFLISIGAINIGYSMIVSNFFSFGSGLVSLVIGGWTIKSASSFKLMVDTEGKDITNLMEALNQLQKLYGLQFWMFMLLLVFIPIAVIRSVMAGGFGAM